MRQMLQWLVRWAAMVATKYRKDKEGKTPYERIKGTRCKMEVVPFGEVVCYKELSDGSNKENKLECKWQEGIWLGHAARTTETIIGTQEGVVKAWAIRRRPEEERWNWEMVNDMRGTPGCPVPGRGGIRIPIRIRVNVDEAAVPVVVEERVQE